MSDTKVITGEVRFSYAHVFEAAAIGEGQEPKFSVSLIIPKSDKKTLDKIEKAVKAAAEEGKAKFGGKIPASYKKPLRDGDEERPDDESYANSYFLNASSTVKPGLVDKDLNPIMDKSEFYSGCYGNASLNFYAFNTNGNKGVAVGLNNLRKTRDGDALGTVRASAETDFAGMEDDDDLL